MMQLRHYVLGAAPLLLALAAACSDSSTGPSVNTTRVYDQVDRLGNPLVAEVFLAKRNHAFHNGGKPSTDVANHSAELQAFITGFGRPASLATTLSSVLLPDMLIIQLNKPATSAGWLTWALANGYGGRKLTDDVVDAGLAATFGTLLDTTAALPAAFRTDNVSANDHAFLSVFPYLAPGN